MVCFWRHPGQGDASQILPQTGGHQHMHWFVEVTFPAFPWLLFTVHSHECGLALLSRQTLSAGVHFARTLPFEISAALLCSLGHHFCAFVSSPGRFNENRVSLIRCSVSQVRAVVQPHMRKSCCLITGSRLPWGPAATPLSPPHFLCPILTFSPLLFHSVTSLLPSCSSPPPFWTDSHVRRPLAHLWPN